MHDALLYAKLSIRFLWQHPRRQTLQALLMDYGRWKRHLADGRSALTDQLPWLSFAAIRYLDRYVRPDMQVFEFGSGGSTLYWAQRVRSVISVEHDPGWYHKMKHTLDSQQISNVEYWLIPPAPEEGFSARKATLPGDYVSEDPLYAGMNFKAYAGKIDEYPDAYFDVILVDGRARPSCILHAKKKLKKNGLLVVDNTERKYYLAPFRFPSATWKIRKFAGPVPYTRHFSETTIIKKLN